jgi:hypothetical protein
MANIPCLIAGGIISTLAVLGIICHFLKECESRIPTKKYFNEKPRDSKPSTKSGRHRLNLEREWRGQDIEWLLPKPYRGSVGGSVRGSERGLGTHTGVLAVVGHANFNF